MSNTGDVGVTRINSPQWWWTWLSKLADLREVYHYLSELNLDSHSGLILGCLVTSDQTFLSVWSEVTKI